MNRRLIAVGVTLAVVFGISAIGPVVAGGDHRGAIWMEGDRDLMFRAGRLKDCVPKEWPRGIEEGDVVPVGGIEFHANDGFKGWSAVFCLAGEGTKYRGTETGSPLICCTPTGRGAFRFPKGHPLFKNVESMRVVRHSHCDTLTLDAERPRHRPGYHRMWLVFSDYDGTDTSVNRRLVEVRPARRAILRLEVPEKWDDERFKELSWSVDCRADPSLSA